MTELTFRILEKAGLEEDSGELRCSPEAYRLLNRLLQAFESDRVGAGRPVDQPAAVFRESA